MDRLYFDKRGKKRAKPFLKPALEAVKKRCACSKWAEETYGLRGPCPWHDQAIIENLSPE